MVKAVVIGGGVHGLLSSLALAREGVQVSLLEKETGVMMGTSIATQYRAHLGYHYPRSPETVAECFEGLEFFKGRYPEALFYPEENYYLLAKEGSKTSYPQYKKFCENVGLPYDEKEPAKTFWNKENIDGFFRVPEPVYNPKILKRLLEREVSELGIDVHTGSRVVGFEKANRYCIISSDGRSGKNRQHPADVIVNATYACTNNILTILGLERDMTRYFLQHTEVVIARSKDKIPALTVMDGPFISLLPIMGEQETGLYVVYDVVHSVLDRKDGYFMDDTKRSQTNWDKMVEHGKEYFPFFGDLEYVQSLYGTRPIPVSVVGDARHTRIKAHQDAPGIYSLFEGKFISAPLMAQRLVEKIKEDKFI
ncbi:FAD-binding oxidoreductase [Candidatus Woesearchaeota archaeon]|nr:FAD-binding oxidoreductase [Candidatus Woesearchaeota archaeon]